MRILINGRTTVLADGATVQAAVEALDLPASGRGVAVAVDAEVARRGVWETRTLADGARVEIVRAVQGG